MRNVAKNIADLSFDVARISLEQVEKSIYQMLFAENMLNLNQINLVLEP